MVWYGLTLEPEGACTKNSTFETHAGYFKCNRTFGSLREMFDYIQVFLLPRLKKRMQPRVQKQVKKNTCPKKILMLEP